MIQADVGSNDVLADEEQVGVVRFAQFITSVVAKRKLPASATKITPRVVINGGTDAGGAQLKVRRWTDNHSNLPLHNITDHTGHVGYRSIWSRGHSSHAEEGRGCRWSSVCTGTGYQGYG